MMFITKWDVTVIHDVTEIKSSNYDTDDEICWFKWKVMMDAFFTNFHKSVAIQTVW